jgi:hypothetical protein
MKRRDRKSESAYKPGSVENSHSSGTCVTASLKRPTRIHRGPRQWIPIWPCSERGLPCRGLLPAARCALTAPFHPYRPLFQSANTWSGKRVLGGLLSVALSVGSHPPGVTWRSALWSPDFPLHRNPTDAKRSGECTTQRLSSRLGAQTNGLSGLTQVDTANLSLVQTDPPLCPCHDSAN